MGPVVELHANGPSAEGAAAQIDEPLRDDAIGQTRGLAVKSREAEPDETGKADGHYIGVATLARVMHQLAAVILLYLRLRFLIGVRAVHRP